MAAIEADRVSFSYGGVTALRDLDLAVPEGALYAMLGPNGSGKTTLLQILMGEGDRGAGERIEAEP